MCACDKKLTHLHIQKIKLYLLFILNKISLIIIIIIIII